MIKKELYSILEISKILFFSLTKTKNLLKNFTPTKIKNKKFYNFYQLELLKDKIY